VPPPLENIYHWWRFDDRVTTSGQPSAAELAELASAGVRRIINLAPHTNSRAIPDEPEIVARLGMRYTNIPVDFQRPTETDFERFCTAMASTERIHIHCGANYRVSAFLFRYRRDVLGADPVIARADMERIWQPDTIWERFLAKR
jgi:protein tyrosine phosphatase (PTP) superfamily phosphohydrolase (DUF442 family)